MSIQRQARSILGLWTEMLWQRRATVAGAVLAVLSLWWLFREPTAPVNGVAACLGAALAWWDIARQRQDTEKLKFVPRDTDDLLDVARAAGPNAVLVRAGREVGVVLQDESRALRQTVVHASLGRDPFRVHAEMATWSSLFLARRAHRSRMWNDPVVGLASDVPTDGGEVALRPCSYFDFVSTNLLAQNNIFDSRRFDPRPVVDGRKWITSRTNSPRSFSDSWLANVIGVSTLAFTTDGKLVVIQQSDRNTGSPGLFAPSGSGALEPQDLGSSNDLAQILVGGANREMCEETGLDPHEVEAATLLGHGRWLSRGAMPEFACVTLLSVSSDELDLRPIPRGERVFTAARHCYRLDLSTPWGPEAPLTPLPHHVVQSSSFPLALAMSLLADVLPSSTEPTLVDLRARLGA